ncbi:MAG: 1-(5-phosphoribosyl)-5-[(5-phosphoribosylamino)methylideneamino] imidazole-4-carboxamide isomerase [Ktedonobacterales bacterium]
MTIDNQDDGERACIPPTIGDTRDTTTHDALPVPQSLEVPEATGAPPTLYPALDLIGGRCVQRIQGLQADGAGVSIQDDDPLAVARRWQEQGATWLHVVDLDGVREGAVKHLDVIAAIVKETGLAIQFGGSPRTEADVAAALAAGASRVTLGAAVVRDQALLVACLAQWGERIAVSVDAREGHITVAGWLQLAGERAQDFAAAMVELGVGTLIIANINSDGGQSGRDDTLLDEIRAALPAVNLIAAGAAASQDDVLHLAQLGVNGVILGRPLYDGALDFAATLAALRDQST